jgi:signal transduction histidine kinase
VVPDLAEASSVDEVANVAVRHAVPMLGEMAFLVTLQDGAIRCRARAHVTIEGQRLLDELRYRFATTLDSTNLLARTIREAQSLIVPVVGVDSPAVFGSEANNDELCRRLGVRSAMAVPLFFRGQLRGGTGFCSDRRSYDADDLRFAEAYARQIVGILENAVLYQQAQEAIRVRDEFLSLASHELRTPLTSLRAAAEVIVRECGTRDARLSRMVGIIARQVERLDGLSARILDASQLAAGLRLRRERVDLAAVIGDVVRSLAERAKKHGSELTQHVSIPIVGEWDRARLEQAVMYLLDNAIKFGAGKPIEVSTELRDGAAVISVRDSGIGISNEQLDRLFDRYHRGVPAHNFGGLGLGLYLVRLIVESHGGTIRVESGVDEGSTFTLELPISFEARQPGESYS